MSSEAPQLLKQGQDAYFAEPPDSALALKCFQRVTELAPTWVEGHHWLASCQEQLALHAEAIKSYRKAIECDPKDPRARIALGRLLSALGHQEQAIVELKDGIALKPHYGEADARLFLAEAYERAGDIRSAKQQWTVVADMDGSYPSYDEPMNEAREKLQTHEDK
jgi:tetratricopeptide (TPR) repeat protein